MTNNTQIHLLFLLEVVFALRGHDPETSRRWVAGGIEELGKPALEEKD